MTLILRPIFKLIDAMRSESKKWQIAWAVVVGMFLGAVPPITLLWVIMATVPLLIRINLGATLLSAICFHILTPLLDPGFHHLGMYLLTQVASMKRVWAGLYHAPIFPFTRFNNSIVLGSFLTCLVLATPMYVFMSRWGIRLASVLGNRFTNSNAWRGFSGSRVYRLYVQFHYNAK